MKRRVIAALLVLALSMSLILVTSASGGTASDPVVSKSYVDGTFFQNMISSAEAKIESTVSSFKTKYMNLADSAGNFTVSQNELVDAVADAVLEDLQGQGKYLYSSRFMSPVSLESGDVISASSGTMVIITDGTGKCSSGSVINITQGKEVLSGNALGRFTTFMFPETGGKIEITSDTAKVLVDGVYSAVGNGYEPKYTDEAYALKKLGLVRGTSEGMALNRASTRAESITMLVRLLGEEQQALAAAHAHPFTDVDEWVQRYVGYGYRMGYTKGVSDTRYNGRALTDAGQYMTFILRSLGYSEEEGDFDYFTALSDAVRLGVISRSTKNELESVEFRRDHVMHISYLALSAHVKDSDMTLLAKLVANGAVDSDAANEFLNR